VPRLAGSLLWRRKACSVRPSAAGARRASLFGATRVVRKSPGAGSSHDRKPIARRSVGTSPGGPSPHPLPRLGPTGFSWPAAPLAVAAWRT
jgi:hypothetical protein